MTTPTPQPITYAKAGGPPKDYYRLIVIDLDTGREVDECREVNTAEGWAEVFDFDDNGKRKRDPVTGKALLKRIAGRFEIRRKS